MIYQDEITKAIESVSDCPKFTRRRVIEFAEDACINEIIEVYGVFSLSDALTKLLVNIDKKMSYNNDFISFITRDCKVNRRIGTSEDPLVECFFFEVNGVVVNCTYKKYQGDIKRYFHLQVLINLA